MTALIFQKLLAMFIVVGIGWVAGRRRWLGEGDAARLLGNVAFAIFVPALLFRTAARLDLSTMPWRTLAAFFVPTVLLLLGVYLAGRRHVAAQPAPARASVQAITAVYGNAVQVGIPLAAALFGESGLGLHLTLVSLHGLVLLTLLTALVEHDLARKQGGVAMMQTLRTAVRNTVVHPVVLPLVAGLACNAVGLRLPQLIDELLQVLGTAVVPVCLVLIGLSLEHYGLRGPSRAASGLSLLKLVVMPAMVLVSAHWVFGLAGQPLAVVVLMAAMPVGSNALIFAQRYRTGEAEATAAIVVSTLAFAATAPLWLLLLAAL
jgi:malonate transporter and related proteins